MKKTKILITLILFTQIAFAQNKMQDENQLVKEVTGLLLIMQRR